jgi:RNA polymerase sigma-70 factor, ECF subfamily
MREAGRADSVIEPPRPASVFSCTLPTMEPDESDEWLLRGLRSGDEQAFGTLVDRYYGSMIRLALSFVRSRAVAEEVVQDTWLAMLRGLGAFEGRSTLKTWLFSILVNRARTTGAREARSVPIADTGPVVDASRFGPSGAWAEPPEQWIEEAESRVDAEKLRHLLRTAMDALPPRQREVVLLRDVEGLTSTEVCEVLSISEANQRVLLHRGRGKLRQVLESTLGGSIGSSSGGGTR